MCSNTARCKIWGFCDQPNVTLIGLGLGYRSQTGTGDAGRRIPSAASRGGTMYQEGVRRAIELPGEAGQIVEGELEAFFSLDLSSVLDSNCFDPQVLIQGCLSQVFAKSRLLEPSEGSSHVGLVVCVDEYGACLQLVTDV